MAAVQSTHADHSRRGLLSIEFPIPLNLRADNDKLSILKIHNGS
jgi:hypothetical protein